MAERGSDAWRKDVWAKPCESPATARIVLHGGAVLVVDSRTEDAWRALNTVLVRFDYRPRPSTTGGLVCRHMRHDPSAPMSAHAWGLAGDLSWDLNPPGSRLVTDMPRPMVDAILNIRTADGGLPVFVWGGDWDKRPDTPHTYYDCMAGDTALVTADGPRAIRDLAGREVMLLSTSQDPRDGAVEPEWVKAPVRSFGWAPTFEVTLRRRHARITVRVTGNHRWAVQDKARAVRFVETRGLLDALRQGDGIPALWYPTTDLTLDPVAVASGIVWGDGSAYNDHRKTPQAKVELCGAKAELRPWLEPHARYWSDTDHGPVAWGLPRALKGLPYLDCPLDEAAGFFAGWFAVDGCVPEGTSPSLSTSSDAALSWLRENAPRLGLTITSVSVQTAGRSGYGSTKDNHAVVFREVPGSLVLRASHRTQRSSMWYRWAVENVRATGLVEEVFCPTVDGRHVVALATPSVPLLTGQSMHYEVRVTPAELAGGIVGGHQEDAMKVGHRGSDVQWLTARLGAVGVPVAVTVEYDAKVEAAVRAFQGLPSVGLPVNGEMGAVDFAALAVLVASKEYLSLLEDERRARGAADDELFSDQPAGGQARRWFARRHKDAHDG